MRFDWRYLQLNDLPHHVSPKAMVPQNCQKDIPFAPLVDYYTTATGFQRGLAGEGVDRAVLSESLTIIFINHCDSL